MIEEIQLEPIPEHLSNAKAPKGKTDNSMLLLDDHNQIDVPLAGLGKKTNLLSEIAEEDDLSTVSESLKYSNGIQNSSKKPGSCKQGSFSNNGKGSIKSTNSTAV